MADRSALVAALAGVPDPMQGNFNAANSAMNLTPQEQALYQRHLTNLWGNGGVTNPDGSRSSLLQMVDTGPDGRFYNVPTVWNGQELNPADPAQRDQIAANVQQAGGYGAFPSYATPEAADARYMQMHDYMDKDTGNYFQIARPDGASLIPGNMLARILAGVK